MEQLECYLALPWYNSKFSFLIGKEIISYYNEENY